MTATLIAAILPVIVAAGIGYLWVQSGRPFDTATLTPLVVEIGTPLLIIATFAKTSIPLGSFVGLATAAVASLFTFALLGRKVLQRLELPVRTFLPSLSFPNNGNLGLPLALYAFGQEGLSYAIIYYAICMVGQFTVGQAVAAGGFNWQGVLRMPLIYAVAIGAVVSLAKIQLPLALLNTLSLIGGMTIPLMLLMLGASLARLPLEGLRRAGVVAGLRIGLGVLVGIVIAWIFGLGGTARSVFVLQCAMPPAVYNYLFAQKWGNGPEEVASVVVIATLASLVTTPILLRFLLP